MLMLILYHKYAATELVGFLFFSHHTLCYMFESRINHLDSE